MGRRFVDIETADCSDDDPPADGTGGSGHHVMVVAGIDSHGNAPTGATNTLDVKALGYHPDEDEVRYFSYAPGGGSYDKQDTYHGIANAARQLSTQIQVMQQEHPGREVDLIAHSQGGVVVDYFLDHFYQAGDQRFPPLGTVVTLSSPHKGAPLATAGAQIRSSALGKAALDVIGGIVPNIPEPNSRSVEDLAETSRIVDDVQRHGVPDHFDFTSIGSTEDVVVPADHTSLRGAHETVVAVDAVSQHTAITSDPDALRAVRAALEGRPPPCVGITTALRAAVAPVVISRASHVFGDVAGTALAVAGAGR
jgi:hypothetical protein